METWSFPVFTTLCHKEDDPFPPWSSCVPFSCSVFLSTLPGSMYLAVALWLVTMFWAVGVLLHTHKGHCFPETTFSVGV